MDLEQLLAEDRIDFETSIIPLSDNKERQDAEASMLFNQLIHSGVRQMSRGEKLTYMKQRMDAFMHRLVKYEVGPMTTLHVLRATVSTAADYPNRAALAEHAASYPAPTLLIFDEAPFKPIEHVRGVVNMNTLRELKSLCSEHESWFDRMRELAPKADPKNHPSTHQLRERDAIRLKINEVATPDVVLSLVRIAMKERGEV